MSVLDTSEICFIDVWGAHLLVASGKTQHASSFPIRTHMKFVVIWCTSHCYFMWRIHFTFYEIPPAMHSLYRSALIKYVIKLLFLCSFNFCSRYPAAGLERRRKHLLTQGRWRNEIYENLSLRLRVNIYSAAYLDSIFWTQLHAATSKFSEFTNGWPPKILQTQYTDCI